MTLDDLLTLPLPDRISWLHSADGPRGKLSHDRFADALGVPNRQTIIGWENGTEPSQKYAEKLAVFSGFPAWVFRRRESEEAAWAMFARRLGAVEGELAETRSMVLRAFDVIHELEARSPQASDEDQRGRAAEGRR